MPKKAPRKKPPSTDTTDTDLTPNAAQSRAAVTCLCAVRDCGEVEAKRRIEDMDPKRVAEIGQLELDNKRKEAIPVIYR